ncbi:hypothetical protein [Chlamydia psittaci]|uniref:hypothetical protein n=1 Tax=Chlamydia psittaci TaxID=83554 RepID=UPI00027E1BC8|nr:hypothetical protein [Chlamydia psittaci]EPJ25641.1 hypothetical protein CP09DC77_0215 [Chlamydia psittaci 09DC77]EPJ30887.1 hypothetical protein CP09DC78_0211 [Chlamydia psittaci 09DC78]EPL00850.1 hypothetical protein CP09DC79_1016 [Chlamydia psittaci 09DC79]AFS21532.1 hypothetical protein B599_0883 [Chlamydia psittaci MN]EPJ27104.1 hypothetical protein CP09DC80_0212 [Chlamydia psittaci 09DC80]
MRFCCFVLFFLTSSLSMWGQELPLKDQGNAVFDKFSPPQYVQLSNGERIWYSYHDAYRDAVKKGKCCIFVYFNPSSAKIWSHLVDKNFCFPKALADFCNIVVLQRGLISSIDYYPKMDPMVLYMGDFQDHFWELDLREPCVILITISPKGYEKVLRVVPASMSNFVDL